MSASSKIEWTDATFNPVRGCTKVSPGCAHCYAETLSHRNPAVLGGWGPGAPRIVAAESYWRQPLTWNKRANVCDLCGEWYAEPVECLCQGQRKLTRRMRVFCASLADVFDPEWPIEARVRMFDTIRLTPNLDWLLLTKRPEQWEAAVLAALAHVESIRGDWPSRAPATALGEWLNDWTAGDAPANVWLGVTVEDQVRAEQRIPILIRIPAKVRFLSCEPLIGAVDLIAAGGIWSDLNGVASPEIQQPGRSINWVICGGESGPDARPMHPQWARSLRDQCAAAGVPFLFKQWGEWSPRCVLEIDGEPYGGGTNFAKLDPQCQKWPAVIRLGEHGKNTRLSENCTPGMGEETFVQRVGKKLAGRILDGREHNAFPA